MHAELVRVALHEVDIKIVAGERMHVLQWRRNLLWDEVLLDGLPELLHEVTELFRVSTVAKALALTPCVTTLHRNRAQVNNSMAG